MAAEARDQKAETTLTLGEHEALNGLADACGVSRAALLRLLLIDGLERYSPEPLFGREARLARAQLRVAEMAHRKSDLG